MLNWFLFFGLFSVAFWIGYVLGFRRGHLEALMWLREYIDHRDFMKTEKSNEVH